MTSKNCKVHSECVSAVRSAFPCVIMIPVFLVDRSDGSFMLDEAIVCFLYCRCSCRDTASFPISSYISRCVRLQENSNFQLVNLLQPATGT